MKKNLEPKRGRPPKARNSLPLWAQKRLNEIARSAGASERKVLELTLQAGFAEIEELYRPIIEYSQNLWAKTKHETKSFPSTLATVPEPLPLEPDIEELTELDPFDEPEEELEPSTDDALERSGLGQENPANFGLDDSPDADRITGAGKIEPAPVVLEEITEIN